MLRIAFQNQKKDFKELKNRELRERQIKITKEIGELFFQTINKPVGDMDKFEQKEIMKKVTFAKNTSYNWLINYTLSS